MQRRRFLNLGLAGLAASQLGAPSLDPAAQDAAPRAVPTDSASLAILAQPEQAALRGRVTAVGDLIPDRMVLSSNRDPLPAERAAARVTAGITALLGPGGWSRLFEPHDVVAIKINALASGTLSPRPEIVAALVGGLRSAGVRAGNIVIWDRTSREVVRSGFPLQTGDQEVRAYGTDALRGGGYSSEIHSFGAVGSLVSRIVSQYATALINVGVLKDHDLAGLSAGMKNLYGVIHNPNRYHEGGCDPFVAEVTALPLIRGKLRLTVIDAVLAQAAGGPAYVAEWIWPADRLLLAVDPVAADQVAWEMLESQRATRGLPSLTEIERRPAWIATAASLGLGSNETVALQEV